MLALDLRELTLGPVPLEARISADTLELEGLIGAPTGPVEVHGEVTMTGAGQYYLRGTARLPIESECRRCLTSVRMTIEVPVDALFSEDAEQLNDPNVYRVSHDAVTLDVTPAVRDELLLTNPSYPLCREDCRGFCPTCGADHNKTTCDCQTKVDPRWDALREHK